MSQQPPGSGSSAAHLVLDQLAGYPCVRPHGGWSLLIDTRSMGLTPGEASRRLFTRAQVAATPMDGWGPSGSRYLRLVFASALATNVHRLGYAALGFGRPQRCWRSLRMRARSRRWAASTSG